MNHDIGGFMKLELLKRDSTKKSETKRLRREGLVPAAIYLKGKDAEPVAIKDAEFSALIREIQPGRLSTTIFNLTDKSGHKRRAILKEIQYEPTTYKVRHLDFEELHDDVIVKVKVPIEFTGVADCVGIKLGGVIRQVIRHLRVACLPKHLPSVFTLDVKNLQIAESIRLSGLSIPETVRPLADLNEVAVVIAKR
jgi:large subunit ribosomal protein L25